MDVMGGKITINLKVLH